MRVRDKANNLRKEHSEWRKYNFENREGFYPVFSDFKVYFDVLSPGAISLFLYFGLHSNNVTGECKHTLETIAKNFNKSVRTISNWINELEENDLIVRLQENFNSPSKTFIIPYTERYIKEMQAIKNLKDGE